jgi:hypothetical protein
MSAEQLAALAGVVGAGNTDAWRLAQEQVAQERARRGAEEERERRHQLELLALQKDVTRTALAFPVCVHAGAHQGDQFCASCGAALPARG